MKKVVSVMYCECVKLLRSKVFWLAFAFFAVALGVLAFGIKPRTWTVFFNNFLPLTGSMGLIVSFFISAWVFGREFSDKTNKDLIAKPVPRTTVVLSKFLIIAAWSLIFMVFLFLFSLAMGLALGFSGFSTALLLHAAAKFVVAFLLYIFLATPGAFFASLFKGILAPIGILFIVAIASNIIGNSGAAPYFPWTIPTILRVTGSLNPVSIVILIATGAAGLEGTFVWWRFAEQG
ncbi:MAG: ABC transporter permease [Coriobacteriia bacterium]|nr:ABC transporter permease [Coriobacteriia bacterium]